MTTKPKSLLGKILVWKARHLSQEQFVILLSILVGLVSGLVAVTLKNLVHLVQHAMHSGIFNEYFNVYYFVFPIVGLGIALIILKIWRKLLGDKNYLIGEGIPHTLFAISRRNGLIKPVKMVDFFISSIITVGFGGSVGLEGPTVGTGSAIGSNLGRVMHLNFKERILIISCATTGAIASIFNAPIAAIIFTIEIFSLDLTFSSLIPLLLASTSGAVTSIFIRGNEYLLHQRVLEAFRIEDLPFYIALGVFAALISVLFNKLYLFGMGKFEKIKKSQYRFLIGGSLLGLLLFLIPPLYGEGYETINHLLNNSPEKIVENSIFADYFQSNFWMLVLIAGMIVFKVVAAVFTVGAGGIGGVFAPSLFVGASTGYVFSRIINDLGLGAIASTNFTLVGMAGLMAGVLHAPLTAVFMIAEITGGYELFIPLMLVAAISFFITRNIMPFSIFNRQLAQRGELLTHNKDHAILTLLDIKTVIERDFKRVSPEMTLGELVRVVSKSRRNLFPVVNEEQELVGVLTLDDFRHIMFDDGLYENTYVSQLMTPPPARIDLNDNMQVVTRKFQESGAWNLPVMDGEQYVGFISKSKLFSVYRQKLLEFS